jgi:hypothetical protein
MWILRTVDGQVRAPARACDDFNSHKFAHEDGVRHTAIKLLSLALARGRMGGSEEQPLEPR